ncbi:unnamed protein product [Brassicogethes aeneus]|uniref:Larval cuticle protein A2B n=1 Tax=Brassicogethes aeneus TaxID=1431903 RepID=A0A9P0BAF6_BRAAE|nr:unnamed protein product [Brassicogethes aeneus]
MAFKVTHCLCRSRSRLQRWFDHPYHVGAPVALAKTVIQEEYHPNPQYSYGYDVQDGLTGDSKSQFETRKGDVVKGRYSLVDTDGHQRIVEYTADPIHGFNAIVQRVPLGVKTVTKLAAPIAYIAPI